MCIRICPRRVAFVLLCVVLGLSAASFAGQVVKLHFSDGERREWIRLLHVDSEANIPTWYSACALFLCSLTLFAIGLAQRSTRTAYANHWLGLAALFLFLSLDEVAGFHELVSVKLRNTYRLEGLLYFGWIIPGAAVVLLIGCVYLRFLAALPQRTRRLFVLAGVLYVGGALGVNALGGRYAQEHGAENLPYQLLAAAEELLEMLGVVLFLYALLDYVRAEVGSLEIGFAPRRDGARAGRNTPVPEETLAVGR